MKRIIEYDNDEQGRFYVVDYQNGKEADRVVLMSIHDFHELITYIEQHSRSFNHILKPVPGLAKKLLEENKKGVKLSTTSRMTEIELGLK